MMLARLVFKSDLHRRCCSMVIRISDSPRQPGADGTPFASIDAVLIRVSRRRLVRLPQPQFGLNEHAAKQSRVSEESHHPQRRRYVEKHGFRR